MPPASEPAAEVFPLAFGAVLLSSNSGDANKIGPAFLSNTVEMAEGTNAVNTILVDFRGFDTLGEIAVLVIAMLGCLGLLMRVRAGNTKEASK